MLFVMMSFMLFFNVGFFFMALCLMTFGGMTICILTGHG
jgi:hypothetical protein